tara:strand:- start:520 stop:735 length:216 start_codon:yes stop_codon:yes gene_type:complete
MLYFISISSTKEDENKNKNIITNLCLLYIVGFIISYGIITLLFEGGVNKKDLSEYDMNEMLKNIDIGQVPF